MSKFPLKWESQLAYYRSTIEEHADTDEARSANDALNKPRPAEITASEQAFMDFVTQSRFSPDLSGEALYWMTLGLRTVWENEGRPTQGRSLRLMALLLQQRDMLEQVSCVVVPINTRGDDGVQFNNRT